MTGKRRVALLGAGSWAGRYAASLAQSETLELVAVAGGSRAPALAEKHGLRLEADAQALAAAEDIEAVIVATPHGAHADGAVPILAAGKAVLVEKPMATSLADCDRMMDAASRSGATLRVAHSRRFFPLVRQARAVLDEGGLGRILMMRQTFCHNARGFGTREGHWMSDPELSLGFFIGYGCHQLDMTIHLAGSRVAEVAGGFGNYWADSPIENCGAMFLRFADGSYTTFWEVCSMPTELQSWPPFPGMCERNEIVCEHGLILLEPYGRLCVRTADDWQTLRELEPRQADPVLDFLAAEVECLLRAADGQDAAPLATPEEGRHVVEVCLAGLESSRTGRAVTLA
ncbi:MAG TPA: Gfo/Idh/MocA family oxidoreductase [Phycisphaerae bacterium]|nr:Gfo/Idh/MocA family oxidoreductase [Phycisphaerae bacterium]